MAKDWLSKLQKFDSAVTSEFNPFDHVIRTPSPSVNFTFGKSHGLPRGFTLALGGPPKGGKTVLCNATVGQLHADDPEAIAIKFDTEFREMGQMTAEQAAMWGIDRNRYMCFSTNTPNEIFDRIEQDIAAMCQEGMPLRLVIIDSITGIQGRRAMNAESIDTQQIGDLALTLTDGFKRIIAVQRKYGISFILTVHVRSELDPLEVKRGNKVRMALPFGVQHHAEYFMFVEPNRNREGRTDLSGNEFKDANLKDLNDNAEQTGHKIRVKMKDSSLGPKGRMAEFTLDYNRGIINVHEEIFLLGKGRGVLERPNNTTYIFGDRKYVGAPAMIQAIKEDKGLAKAILDEIQRRDAAGAYSAEDVKNELE